MRKLKDFLFEGNRQIFSLGFLVFLLVVLNLTLDQVQERQEIRKEAAEVEVMHDVHDVEQIDLSPANIPMSPPMPSRDGLKAYVKKDTYAVGETITFGIANAGDKNFDLADLYTIDIYKWEKVWKREGFSSTGQMIWQYAYPDQWRPLNVASLPPKHFELSGLLGPGESKEFTWNQVTNARIDEARVKTIEEMQGALGYPVFAGEYMVLFFTYEGYKSPYGSFENMIMSPEPIPWHRFTISGMENPYDRRALSDLKICIDYVCRERDELVGWGGTTTRYVNSPLPPKKLTIENLGDKPIDFDAIDAYGKKIWGNVMWNIHGCIINNCGICQTMPIELSGTLAPRETIEFDWENPIINEWSPSPETGIPARKCSSSELGYAYIYFSLFDGGGYSKGYSQPFELKEVPASGASPTPTPTPGGPTPTSTPVGQPTGCTNTPDLNCDGTIDLMDFSVFLDTYSTGSTAPQPGCSNSPDLDCNGIIDLVDFSIFLDTYIESL